jgi:hypothetical protein
LRAKHGGFAYAATCHELAQAVGQQVATVVTLGLEAYAGAYEP